MFLYNNKRIRINLDFNSNAINIDIEPFQTVKHLKDIIIKIYQPMNFQPKLIYLEKDISEYENQILADLFKNKSSVNLKVLQPSPVRIKLNSNNKLNENYLRRNKDIYNILSSSLNHSNNLNSYSLKLENKFHQTIISPELESKRFKTGRNLNNNYTCHCGAAIFNYCFNCKEYFCNLCKLNHNSHNFVHVDPHNIEESIKLYSISLQAGLSQYLNKAREYDKLYKNSPIIDPESRQEMIIRRLDELEKLYQGNIMKENAATFEIDCNSIEKSTYCINKEIEKICEELSFNILNKKRNLNLDRAKEIFDNIYIKENNVDEMKKEINRICNYFQFTQKIDSLYNELDRVIDSIISEVNSINKSHKSSSHNNYNTITLNKVYKNEKSVNKINLKANDFFSTKPFIEENLGSLKKNISRATYRELELKPTESSEILKNYKNIVITPQPRRPGSDSRKNSLISSIPCESSTGFNLNIDLQSPRNIPVGNLVKIK